MGTHIGRGAYSIVKSGVHKENNKRVAIKIYEKFKIACTQRKCCVNREISLLKRLHHPNIVKLYETIDTKKQLFLIMEYVRGKSLLNYIRLKKDRKLEERDCIRIYRQLLQGIAYCHENNVSHRDIKMENVLLDEGLNVKIIDFGFSFCSSPNQRLKVFCGTPSYMAPEIVSKKPYLGAPADMWSMGVLLYVMLCGMFPFRGNTELDLYRCISKGLYSIPSDVSIRAKQIIGKLLNLTPERRPTAAEVRILYLFV